MKNSMLSLIVITIISLFAFTSCEERTAAEKAEDRMEDTAEEIGDEFGDDREEISEDIRDAREDINEKIASIREDMEDASDESKVEMQRQIDKLDRFGAKLDKDLEKVGENIKDGWGDFKDNVSKTIEDIERDLKS